MATATRPAADFIEDAQWLADTGESWSMAAIRLGYGTNLIALERRLHRHGRFDLITTLRSHEIRNPADTRAA